MLEIVLSFLFASLLFHQNPTRPLKQLGSFMGVAEETRPVMSHFTCFFSITTLIY